LTALVCHALIATYNPACAGDRLAVLPVEVAAGLSDAVALVTGDAARQTSESAAQNDRRKWSEATVAMPAPVCAR